MSGSAATTPRVRRRRPDRTPKLRPSDPLPSRSEQKAAANARQFAAAEAYWQETRQPFACLLFLAPLLVAYELGVLWLGGPNSDLLRGGADGWMRSWLYAAGVQHAFVLPLVVLGLLLLWNFYGLNSWRVRAETLGGMLAESLIFAFTLMLLGQASQVACRACDLPTACVAFGASPAKSDLVLTELLTAAPAASPEAMAPEAMAPDAMASPASCFDRGLAKTVTFVGAGVYEEVLFRLLLLPGLFTLFRLLRTSVRGSTILAVLSSSLLFALAHYVGPAGDAMTAYSFAFRSLAGVYFAALFLTRGFGVTVGAHACYDIFVGVLWLA